MSENGQMVGPLKKISLLLEAATVPDRSDLTTGPIVYEFIFGAGSQGLCPFELHLSNKKVGESFDLRVRRDELTDYFQHLLVPSLPIPERVEGLHLKVKILGVSEPDPKEVIKALAEAGSCGDRCCGH